MAYKMNHLIAIEANIQVVMTNLMGQLTAMKADNLCVTAYEVAQENAMLLV